MSRRLDDDGNVNYACPFCESFDTTLISKMLVGDPADVGGLAYHKRQSIHEYECNECQCKFYIDESTREIIENHIVACLDEGEE